MQKNLIQQLKVYIESLAQKSKEYCEAESQRDELSLTEIIILAIFLTILGTTIP